MTTRRNFLKSSAAAGITAFAAPAVAMNVRGANERIRVGLVGLGGRMQSHIGSLTVLTIGQRRDRRDLRLRPKQARQCGENISRSARLEAQDYRDQRKLSTIKTSTP